MMQSADLRYGDHLAFGWVLDSTRYWRVTFQRKMSSGFVIVCEVTRQDSSQVALVEYNDVVEAFPAN